jgi:hypothetical protein
MQRWRKQLLITCRAHARAHSHAHLSSTHRPLLLRSFGPMVCQSRRLCKKRQRTLTARSHQLFGRYSVRMRSASCRRQPGSFVTPTICSSIRLCLEPGTSTAGFPSSLALARRASSCPRGLRRRREVAGARHRLVPAPRAASSAAAPRPPELAPTRAIRWATLSTLRAARRVRGGRGRRRSRRYSR